MKNDKEIVGTLLGFDDYVSILFVHVCPDPRPGQVTLLGMGRAGMSLNLIPKWTPNNNKNNVVATFLQNIFTVLSMFAV